MGDERKVNLSVKVGESILTLRADTVVELNGLISEAEQDATLALFLRGGDAKAVPTPAAPSASGSSGEASADTVPSDEEAEANLKKELGATVPEEPATPALIKVAAKKSGKSVEELEGISKSEAQRLIKEGKK